MSDVGFDGLNGNAEPVGDVPVTQSVAFVHQEYVPTCPGQAVDFFPQAGFPLAPFAEIIFVVRYVGDVLRVSDGDFRAEMIDAGIPDHSVDVVFH